MAAFARTLQFLRTWFATADYPAANQFRNQIRPDSAAVLGASGPRLRQAEPDSSLSASHQSRASTRTLGSIVWSIGYSRYSASRARLLRARAAPFARTRPRSPGHRVPWAIAIGGSGGDRSASHASTCGMKPENATIASGRGRPAPRPERVAPSPRPARSRRARRARSGSESSHARLRRTTARTSPDPDSPTSRHRVPVRAARRQRQRAARAVAVKPALRVEHVEQREEIVLVGAAPVEEHERALGLAERPAARGRSLRALRGAGSAAASRICSTCARYCS